MRALVCPRFGDPSVVTLQEWPETAPGRGEVRVLIHAAGVNYPDVLSIAGTYPVKSEPPFVPGIEGAGEVLDCGPEVDGVRPGDRVCWQDNTVKGGFAEQVTLPAIRLSKLPDELDYVRAASVPTVYGTALFALDHRAQLRPGEVLVVHGASGGVGLAAVQVGKMMGATVIGTGGDDEKLKVVRENGADHVINYRTESIRDRVLELTDGRGADVYVDPVGGDLFDASMRAIARYGRILVIGFTSGRFAVARTNILLVKGASVIGASYGRYLDHEPEQARAAMGKLLGWIVEGRLRPHVHETFPLSRGVEALQGVVDRRVVGKYVLLNQQR